MKALMLTAHDRLEIVDVAEPELGAHDVLVRIRACGICGSDVHGLDGSSGRRIPPLIMGHEAAGDIARVGDAVTAWRPGDRVTFDSTISCNACAPCRAGLVNLCDRRRVIGVAIPEYRAHGAFAEFIAVPEHILYRLPDTVSYVEGATVEPLSVAAHAALLTATGPDARAVVVGTGVIGLLLVQVLRAHGCRTIVAVDLDEGRLALAERFGATATLRADARDVVGAIRAATGGDGADVAFEAVGIASTVTLATTAVRKGGAVVLVGNVTPTVDLPLQAVVTRQLSLFGSAASAGEYPECIDMIAARRVDVAGMVSAVAPLEEGAAWFERLRAGREGLLKVVLEP
ncbi:MAG TPA: alcohol dehydrogenase catalytic domain-containing protein [Candidatus Limnocylindrales bacterium]